LLGGRRGRSKPVAFGDPALLLPLFHRPKIEKRWELGLFAENPALAKKLPSNEASVRLIPNVTGASASALRSSLNDFLSCKRIVSDNLLGLVIAEAYQIPCVSLMPVRTETGIRHISVFSDDEFSFSIRDFYAGVGVARFPAYRVNRRAEIDWDDIVASIEASWRPISIERDELMESMPVAAPIAPPDTGDIFELPLIQSIPFTTGPQEIPQERAEGDGVASAVRPQPGRRADASALQRWVDEHGSVPLSWAATTPAVPDANLGDALSAVTVSVLTGLPIEHRNFDNASERLVSVGTIGHQQKNGTVHIWGTGFRDPGNPPHKEFYSPPPDTHLRIHAVRGPLSGRILRRAGVEVPEIYGDPVWFLPKFATPSVEKRWELGIVVHISELVAHRSDAPVKPDLRRYHIPPSLLSQICIINTYTAPTARALMERVDDIRACRRIASTSFHGLVIAETFGIPCVWFSPHPCGAIAPRIDDTDVRIDQRVRDFYYACPERHLPIYGVSRQKPTAWEDMMDWIDSSWSPLQANTEPLFDAFPLRKAVRFEDPVWPADRSLLDSIRL
jgi:hypothetical protein